MNCHTCGYPEAWHDLGSLKCPPETADKNGRRGTFKAPGPLAPRHEWFGGPAAPKSVKAAPHEPPRPPQVPARLPYGPTEYATSTRGMSAAKLGRKAADSGWQVQPTYWRAADGTEGCGLKIAKGVLRAVATWKRKPGGSWAVDIAYAWRIDVARFPSKLTHTDLEGLIK